MLSSPKKPPAKMLFPFGILAVDPPGEIHQQLLKDALQKRIVSDPYIFSSIERRDTQPKRGPAG